MSLLRWYAVILTICLVIESAMGDADHAALAVLLVGTMYFLSKDVEEG